MKTAQSLVGPFFSPLDTASDPCGTYERPQCAQLNNMNTQFSRFVWTVVLVIASQHSVCSQSTLFFERASFVNECQGVPGVQQTIYFQELGYLPVEIGPVLTISNMTFTGRYLSASMGALPGGALWNFDSDVPLTIQFANGVRAFGGDFSSSLSPYFSSFTATLTLDNGETFNFPSPSGPGSQFFGFISPTPIRDITFSDGGVFPVGIDPPVYLHQELLGNLFMVLEIPEPSSLVLLGGGGLLLAGHLVRRSLKRKGRRARKTATGVQ